MGQGAKLEILQADEYNYFCIPGTREIIMGGLMDQSSLCWDASHFTDEKTEWK